MQTINELFKKPLNPGTDPKLMQMLDNIYTDKMALVIELDIDDVKEDPFTFPAIQKLVDMKVLEPITPENMDVLKRLYYALLVKENVGFFFWFLLIGIFCILVSTNTLLSSNCTPKIGSTYHTIFKK